jgi:diguanylate cyclase (GGDEF)-like protein
MIVDKIFNEIDEVFSDGKTDLKVSLSIGIAISEPQSTESIDELLKQADTALYQVKRSGRNGFSYYNRLKLLQINKRWNS